MKKLVFTPLLVMVLSSLSLPALAETTPKELYLNKDLGFNVEGYKYNQASLPCDIDKFLVDDIVHRGAEENIKVNVVGNGDSIPNTGAPLLAIEINALSLGKDKFKFGVRNDSVLPAVKVTAGLISGNGEDDMILAKHSCAIATLQELNPNNSSNILDLGTYGTTVCDATQKCLKNLSKDIVQ